MKNYIGTKLIAATPMTRLAYNQLRGWQLPADENGDDEGYLVEYQDGGKPNMAGYEGYVSWSPKEQFEKAYRPTDGISFGLAIEAVMQGYKVARSGWNGKGMFIWLKNGAIASSNILHPDDPHYKPTMNGVSFALFDLYAGDVTTRMPCLCMHAAGGETVEGWLASQTDILASDWQIV